MHYPIIPLSPLPPNPKLRLVHSDMHVSSIESANDTLISGSLKFTIDSSGHVMYPYPEIKKKRF